jgi:hypothetical protein
MSETWFASSRAEKRASENTHTQGFQRSENWRGMIRCSPLDERANFRIEKSTQTRNIRVESMQSQALTLISGKKNKKSCNIARKKRTLSVLILVLHMKQYCLDIFSEENPVCKFQSGEENLRKHIHARVSEFRKRVG